MKYITFDNNLKLKAKSLLFPIWQPNHDYIKNEDYILYNDDLYMCINTHTSDINFNTSNWKIINGANSSEKLVILNINTTNIPNLYSLPDNITITKICFDVLTKYDNDVNLTLKLNNNNIYTQNTLYINGVYNNNTLLYTEKGGLLSAVFNKVSTQGLCKMYLYYY